MRWRTGFELTVAFDISCCSAEKIFAPLNEIVDTKFFRFHVQYIFFAAYAGKIFTQTPLKFKFCTHRRFRKIRFVKFYSYGCGAGHVHCYMQRQIWWSCNLFGKFFQCRKSILEYLAKINGYLPICSNVINIFLRILALRSHEASCFSSVLPPQPTRLLCCEEKLPLCV